MNKFKNVYHTRIKPEFLFDANNVFKSNYTPWVYVHIRILKNPFYKKPSNFTFNLNVNEIADLFNTNPDTIYTCINDLEQVRMIEKQGPKYKLLSDSNYCTPIEGYRPYIEISRDTFNTQLNEFKFKVPEDKDNRGLLAKVIKVYYYLINSNGHCLLDKPVVESYKTQTSLSRELKMDSRTTKQALSILESTGYIKYNDKNRILTIDKNLYVETQEIPQTEDYYTQSYQPIQVQPAKVIPAHTISKPKVPEDFIGFFKSQDGLQVYVIFYDKQSRDIMWELYCEGNGIPHTREEIDKEKDLIANGKDSIYYNKNSYWTYQNERKEFKAKKSKKVA
jgi:hypothetical protein